MSSSSPRAGGPSRRRSFTPQQKRAHLAAYEQACQEQQGGAYLRRQGLYSSLISEWRRLREAGVLEGKTAGEAIGRPSAEQAEIARLRRELESTRRRLDTTFDADRSITDDGSRFWRVWLVFTLTSLRGLPSSGSVHRPRTVQILPTGWYLGRG